MYTLGLTCRGYNNVNWDMDYYWVSGISRGYYITPLLISLNEYYYVIGNGTEKSYTFFTIGNFMKMENYLTWVNIVVII